LVIIQFNSKMNGPYNIKFAQFNLECMGPLRRVIQQFGHD
jgi:hypothetical protein